MNEGARQWLIKELDVKHRAYSGGNFGSLKDALKLCSENQVPLPRWLAEALQENLTATVSGNSPGSSKEGRQSRWITQYREDMRDFVRADTVQDCIDHGVPRVDAPEAASLMLRGNFGEGAPDTIRKACTRYKRRSKTQPFRYHMLSTLRLPETTISNEALKAIQALRVAK